MPGRTRLSTFFANRRATAIAFFTEGWNRGAFARVRTAFAPTMTPDDLERIVAAG